MALNPLTEDQLNDLSDEELDQRMKDESLEGIEEDNANSEGDEPEENADVEPDPEPETIDGEDDDSDDEVDAEEDDTSDVAAGETDGNPEADDEDTETETTETPESFRDLKVDGQMIKINSIDELYTLASGGGNITQKLQRLARGKKALSIMDDNKLTAEDISLLVEARSGNKDALATLMKQSGVEAFDIPDEVTEGYQPGQHVPSDARMNLKDVQDEISGDPEYQTTVTVVNDVMDERSQQMLVENPMYIKGIHMDIKSGAYQTTQAEATKLKMMDGGGRSDMEYYIEAAQQAQVASQSQPQQQEQPQAQKPRGSKSKKRSAGSFTKKTPAPGRVSVDDMTDDELMAYREEIMSR